MPVLNNLQPVGDFIGVAIVFFLLTSCTVASSVKTEFVLLGCIILKRGFIFQCCLYVKVFFTVAVFFVTMSKYYHIKI